MAEKNELAVSSNDTSVTEDAKPRYYTKTSEYLSFPILLLIFKYLSVYDLLLRVGLVCKSWYHVARDRELWMTVNLSAQQKLKPGDLLKLLSFSNFRIIDLHLPHRGQEGRISVHEERSLILLLRKCKCLRVLQFCQRCWKSRNTDAVQEANSSLEIKFAPCAVPSCHERLHKYRHAPLIGMDHAERIILIHYHKQEEKMQDVNKIGDPKASLGPYNNIMRQARKCGRQKYELRPPVNILKQTKSYHQPRKRQIKRSVQKNTKQ